MGTRSGTSPYEGRAMMRKGTRRIVVAVVLALCMAGPAGADFAKGKSAYDAGDFEEAHAAWRALAERGDRDAQYWLGRLLEQGQGVEPDPIEALKWYALAWKRGVTDAKAPALALKARLPPEQYEEAVTRLRAWKKDFRARAAPDAKGPAGDLATFRVNAETKTRDHPDNAKLRTLCSAKIEKSVVTFVTDDGVHVLVVAITPRPLADPRKDIWLDFKWVYPRSGGPYQSARGGPEGPTGTLDWAYVYDRNQDDRIDYLAYLDGPNVVIPHPRPANLPRLTGRLTKQQVDFAQRHTRQVFWHMSDDDFDGQVDGFIVPTRDRQSGWIDGQMLVHSSAFDGNYDQCRFVPNAAGTPDARCRRTGQGYGVPGKTLSGLLRVPAGDDFGLLELLNEAARACGLTSRHFRRE